MIWTLFKGRNSLKNCCFLVETMTPKCSFEINWPLYFVIICCNFPHFSKLGCFVVRVCNLGAFFWLFQIWYSGTWTLPWNPNISTTLGRDYSQGGHKRGRKGRRKVWGHGGTGPHQFLADKLTLFKSGGPCFAHLTGLSLPNQ